MEALGGRKSNNSSGNSPPPKKFIVKFADMSDDMLEHAFDIASFGFDKYTVKQDAAEYIKKTLDKFHGPSWHCIVGNFSGYVSHEKKQLVYFTWEETSICLYKTGAIYDSDGEGNGNTRHPLF